jgi:hypothetical protein
MSDTAGFSRPGFPRPIFSGHVYKITDPTSFFLPILGGQQGPPQQGYQPWSGLEVRTWSVNDLIPIPLPGGSAQTQADGSFGITQPPPNATVPGGTPSDVRFMLLVTEGSFPYRPLYRSDLSLSVGRAETTELNIYLLPETIDAKNGITAGNVSTVLKGSALPGNTQITASPSGLSFSGSQSGADVKFGISIVPDRSFNLSTFLDLALSSWNIHVGWPADWCTNADDILVEISTGLQGAAGSMNAAVLTDMEKFFAAQEGIPLGTGGAIPSIVKTFFNSDVSVTFMDVTFPTQHTWSISNTTDSTVVVTGDLCVGYPRHLSSDPSTIPVFEAIRLSRPLRPVLV